MKLVAIRHTSVDVEPGICYGQSNVALARTFQKEREEVALRLNGIRFDKIYSSPLLRCMLLAEFLFDTAPVFYDDRLRELDFGEWELKSWNAIYNDPLGKVWMDNYQNLPTLNGESYPQMVERVSAFLNEVKLEENNTVAIVAHAGVIRILKSIIENCSIEDLFNTFKPEYGSVTEFEI
ncbi:alpha-ribazole phosphatase [uncultured Draconibacterium sp.]|uniref:alpha-ribazole phosphatase n=1 Tax=uncultured Draconibacterium sp. TaxID=1573823 RepID=UPI003216393F